VIQVQALQTIQKFPEFPRISGESEPFAPKDIEDIALGYLAKFHKTEDKQAAKAHPVADMVPALACRFRTLGEFSAIETQRLKNAVAACRKDLPPGRRIEFGADELQHYYYAQVMFVAGGKEWGEYCTPVFEQLRTAQDKDGAWRSSKGIGVGRVYATAVWCIVLQLQNESFPSVTRVQNQRLF
jgi:hypothetical protein